MKNGILRRRLTHIAGSASAVILLGGMLTGCKDDLLTGMPDWLGSSIYEELESRGNFTETLKLINDEAQGGDYASVLRKTGSKTLFVADDDAWKEFYKSNPWGVTCYEDLSVAQKKLLFKGNMINSAYLLELLGNIPAANGNSDPVEGSCMRRISSVDLSDSIPVITSADYPEINPVRLFDDGKQIDYWSEVRGRDTMKIFMDDNVATMIHFMPRFMLFNNVTDHDVDFMTNGGIKSIERGFINGKVVREGDVVCQNGYIHVLDGVPTPMDNMAQVINSKPQFSMYSRLLERFSYPEYSSSLSARYGDGEKDSVFVKRYFNKSGNHALSQMRNLTNALEVLDFDPGWNRFVIDTKSEVTYQNDGAMMLVPTDEAMRKYLDTDGQDLRDLYGTAEKNGYDAWDNAPDGVVLPLLQNTMFTSLKSSIPSVFSTIVNTAKDPMGVKEEDIDYTHWACNGVVYETNKVYVAPDYVSVYYPCVIRGSKDLSLMYTTIKNDDKVAGGEGFKAYLNNMGSQYSFIIPTDNALQHYYDPVSYKRTDNKDESTAVNYEFYINSNGNIAARSYLVDWDNLDEYGRGTITEEPSLITPSPENKNSSGDVFNHMKDIINGSMAMGLLTPGQKFYQAKNGSPIVVEWDGDVVKGVAGSFQYERGYFIPVTESFDKSVQGNGRSYLVDMEPLQSTTLSPYAAITDPNRPEFQAFASLLEGCNFIGSDDKANHATMDKALTNMSNYHYTIYVPKSESIEQLITEHRLPTFDDRDAITQAIAGIEELKDELENNLFDEAGDTIPAVWKQMNDLDAEKEFLQEQDVIMTDVISNFVSYHIQDNSVFVDGAAHSNSVFESACLDTATTRFAKVYVDYTPGGKLTVTDNTGKTHTVDETVNNILTRQYFFNGANLKGNSCTQIYSSSYAVIHMIDTPMMPFKDNDPKHPDNGYYNPDTYKKVMDIVAKYYVEEPETEPDVTDVNPVKRHKR